MKEQTHELLRGTLTVIILRLLELHGRLYGYELTQKVRDMTQDKIQITEGALYPALHKLEAEGVIAAELVFIGKRQRKYYRLTVSGTATARARVGDLLDFMVSLQLIMQ